MKKLISLLSATFLLAALVPQWALAYTGVGLANDQVDSFYFCNWTDPFCLVTSDTTDAQDAGTADVTVPTDLSDAMYFGYAEMFDGVAMEMFTEVSGFNSSEFFSPDGIYIIGYWNGSSWVELDLDHQPMEDDYDFANDTTSWSETWLRPTDWATTTVGSSSSMYYVKLTIDEEYSSTTTATATRVGVIDYNLKVEVVDELGFAIEGLEEADFVLDETTGGLETIYAFEELSAGLYGFAIDPSSGSEYELSIYPSGFVGEDRPVSVDFGEILYDDFDMAYSHMLEAENAAGASISIAVADAGASAVDCNIDGVEAYCAVDIGDDSSGTEANLYADGYIPASGPIANRNASSGQARDAFVMEYGYIATVHDQDSNPVTTATVMAGDDLDIACYYLGTGQYGCAIPSSNADPLVSISATGYETLESTFGSERHVYTAAQVTGTFTLEEETTVDPDPDPVDDGTDTDSDGLTDVEEDDLGTDENDADTDNDGLEDGEEVDMGTDPKDSDSDGDGLEDGEEVDLGTDPEDADTDNDGDNDGDEVTAGTDPLVDEGDVTASDSDGDGLDDDDEADWGTDENDRDTDDDGVSDGAEVATDTDPLDREDFLADAEDYDADCSDPFTDTAGNFAQISICILHDEGIVQGRSATTFEPSASITRAEYLKIILLNAGLTITPDTSVVYTDVPSSAWYYSYITYATSEGYVEGYEDGGFHPDAEINRAEAMIMMMRIAGVEETDVNDSDINFSDVDDSDWFAWAIVEADQEGISEGYDDGTFKPGNSITRAEVAVIARRAWYVYY